MKRIYYCCLSLILLILPLDVLGYSCDTKSISTNKVVKFNHCMKSECNNYINGVPYWNTPYYTNESIGVSCSNGNTSPYVRQVSSTCPKVGNICNMGEARSCSVTLEYDCSKTSSGANFFTTTTTKKTTKKRTTTKKTTTETSTTTIPIKSNTKLSSLIISNNELNFNSDIYEYNIHIESDVGYLNITAMPQDETSIVEIKDNANLVDGSIISIIVTGADGSTSVYKINIIKETYIMSSNAKLSNLSVDGYQLSFNSKINEYSLIVDRDTTSLNINYEVEDEKSNVIITGNDNLVDGSKINIDVTAEDGTVNTYIINITMKKESNFLKILFIIILILAILAGAYYIYKKIVLNKKGDKYEYE